MPINNPPSYLIQTVVKDTMQKRSRVVTSQSQPSVTRSAQDYEAVYFDISLYDKTKKEVQEVEAGKSYELVISGDFNASTTQHIGIKIASTIHLALQCTTDIDTPISINIEGFNFDVDYDNIPFDKDSFFISIPSDCPSCELIFTLVYTSPNRRHHQEANQRKIQVRGRYTPDEKKWFDVHHINATLPKNVALLRVERYTHQPEHLSLRGWSYLHPECPFHLDNVPHADVSLAKFTDRKERLQDILFPEDIIHKLRRFSENTAVELIDWLRELYEHAGKYLSLVIIDLTSFETPWEMLELDDEEYLGALFKVVRWIPTRRAKYVPQLTFVDEPLLQPSSVIAYIDEKELRSEDTHAESSILTELQTEHHATTISFKQRIEQPLQDVGLVYLGSHGYEGQVLGSQQRRENRITYYDFEIPYKHPEPRPVFFFNACDSACFTIDTRGCCEGFVEVLLARFASGYIGTLGRVGVKQAGVIAKHILKAARSSTGVQIAEVLRQLRAEAVKQLQEAKEISGTITEQYEYNLLYTFMYVYYGNPLARLQLREAGLEGKKA